MEHTYADNEPKRRSQPLTAKQAEGQITGYEEVIEHQRQILGAIRRQIANGENDILKNRKAAPSLETLEYYKQLEQWYAADVEKLSRELQERRLLVSGWTWEQIFDQRHPVKEADDEPTLF